ncbi:MAG: hypothetical protein AAB223_11320 [Pseudomonadota bacterium]
MPKKSRPRKTPARRNPFAPLARAMRAKEILSKKSYRRKEKHPKKGAGGNGNAG